MSVYGKEVEGGRALKNDGKKTVGFVTGSRADYGIMRRFLKLLDEDDGIELKILVTGALLSDTYGKQVDLIYEDGFSVAARIEIPLDSSSDRMILHAMAEAMDKFASCFGEQEYDLLMILGDRYEMLSAAVSAAMQKIPILHIHGGEATYGNYDEFIRHGITKMSLYHFTATEEYRNRVIQLGEHPDRVFSLGALGAENCLFMDEKNIPDDVKALERKGYFVVLFHPETLTNSDVVRQMEELLSAAKEFSKYRFVFLGANADTNSGIIRRMVAEFVYSNKNCIYFENLHTDAYHYLLKNSICLVGNSSSGLIEAPSLGIYTVNIGDRQKGRVRGNSVIDVECRRERIVNAMRSVMEPCGEIPVNPYYQENSAGKYYEKLTELLGSVEEDRLRPKEFYDLSPVCGGEAIRR